MHSNFLKQIETQTPTDYIMVVLQSPAGVARHKKLQFLHL